MSAGKRGRPPIPAGEHGAFLPKKNGAEWRCRARYRDLDGVRREFTASGKTKQQCLDDAARRWIEIRNELGRTKGRLETSMPIVAAKWLASVESQVRNGLLAPGTLDQYRTPGAEPWAPL